MKNNIESRPFLDIDGLAKILHKTPRTIRQMCYNNTIPHFIVGKKRIFKYEEIVQWLEQHCRAK